MNQPPQERIVYVEKKKNGGCMKWGAVILGGFVVLGIIGSLFGDDTDTGNTSQSQTSTTQSAAAIASSSEADQNQTSENSQPEEESKKDEKDNSNLTIGQAYTTRDGMDILINDFNIVSGVLGQHACADVTYANNGKKQTKFQGYWDWKVQDPNGAITDPTFTGERDLESGELAPGGSVSGNVCFKSADPGEYRIMFDPTLSFSSDKATWVANL